jgi:integrase
LTVREALRFSAYTFARPGNTRQAEWEEINFDNSERSIPKEKMKMTRSHIVTLATQAAELLRKMRQFTGHGRYVFPSARTQSGSRPLSDAARVAALRALGYPKEEMTAHGFRHTASTMLNNSRLWDGDVIERQLAHEDSNRVRGIYNAAEYLPERRRMMQWWADYLDELKK